MALSVSPIDGVAYATATWDDLHEDIFSSGYSDKACIVKGRRGAGKNFQVAGTSSPVTVEEGVCYLKGKRVVNTSSINVNIVSPSVNPRIDRVIVKYVFATDAITVELLAGTEDPSPTAPSLTQIDGNTWEVSLAQVYITTGGAITVTNERRWAVPLGVFMAGEIKAIKATLGGTANKHPIDPDLGSADEDWALCDGGTYNGYVTDDLRDRMIIGAGTTYSAGTAYGSATANLYHRHAASTITIANESAHTHGATGLTTGQAGANHYHGVSTWVAVDLGYAAGAWNASLNSNTANTNHAHTVNGNTAAGSAHSHTPGGNTDYALSAAQSVLNPCLARAYFMYCPAI